MRLAVKGRLPVLTSDGHERARFATPRAPLPTRPGATGAAPRTCLASASTALGTHLPAPEAIGEPGAYPFTRGLHETGYRGRLWTMRQYAGFRHRGRVEPALPLLAGAGDDGPLRGLRPAHPDRLRLGRPPRHGRSGPGGRRHRQPRGHGDAARRPAPRAHLHLDDDQRDRVDPAGPLRGGRAPPRHPGGRPLRHRAERHPQGVRGARDLHLSAGSVAAPRHRRPRLLRRARPEVEPDLDLRLPHPRGRGHGAPGDRLHLRPRRRVRARGQGRGARSRALRRAAVVLLRLPLRLHRGGGEVPRGAPSLGAHHEGAIRRRERRRPSRCASTSRPAA